MGSTGRAKANDVVRSLTCASARSVVVCVAVRCRTCVLEHLWVRCWWACLRCRVVIGAAEFWLHEGGAGAPAGYDGARISHLQFRWADSVQVRDAAGVLAVAGTAACPDADAHIVAVDEANVVKIHFAAGWANGEFRQCDWRLATADAFKCAAAVTRLAFPIAGAVEVAASSCPEPTGPSLRSRQLYRSTGGQRETAVAKNRRTIAGERSRP